MTTAPAGDGLAEMIETAAFCYARRERLVCEDGTIVCRACRDREALLPSLHCGGCLGGHYAAKRITSPSTPNRAQTAADKSRAKG